MHLSRLFLSSVLVFLVSAAAVSAAPDNTTADAVLGQAGFTTNLANQGGAATGATLDGVRGLYVDTTGRLWVADTSNNRVLMWNNASSFTNGQAADLVLGQADFTSVFPNRTDPNVNANPAPAQNTLTGPRSVAVDTAGRVYVADSGNIRILRYDPPFTNGMNASQVFGQAGSFTTKTQANAANANENNMGNPDGVAVDAAGNLFLADLFLKRVLIYNTPAAGAGDTTADVVIGQPNFNAANANQGQANPAANTLNNPEGVATDAAGNLYVADQENHRVLLFQPPFANNMNASRVFGQPNFNTGGQNQGGRSATSMSIPVYVCIDPNTGNLYVADSGNSRILEFVNPQSDSTADRVFGQLGDFTTGTPNTGGISADSLNDVGGVAADAAGNMYAGDRLNHRVLRYNAPAAPNPNNPPGGGNGEAPCGLCGPSTATAMPMLLVAWIAARRRLRR